MIDGGDDRVWWDDWAVPWGGLRLKVVSILNLPGTKTTMRWIFVFAYQELP